MAHSHSQLAQHFTKNNILTLLICRFPFVMKLCQGEWIDVEPHRCIQFIFSVCVCITCKKSRGVAPSTCKILSYPESWQNSKNVFPNNSKMSSAGISANNKIKKTINFVIFSFVGSNPIILWKSIFHRKTIVIAIKDPINTRIKLIPFQP